VPEIDELLPAQEIVLEVCSDMCVAYNCTVTNSF